MTGTIFVGMLEEQNDLNPTRLRSITFYKTIICEKLPIKLNFKFIDKNIF
jgi:hypothetical protein